MKARSLFLVVAVLILLAGYSPRAAAQPPIPPLPADLLFTTNLAEVGDKPRNVIARVDAETLEVTPFYIDAEAFAVVPLCWAPQGDLLADYRVLYPIDDSNTLLPRELCILDRGGALFQCMDDALAVYGVEDPPYWGSAAYFPITWGHDGQTIYFETEYTSTKSHTGYGRRLVEADALTGETLRVVYDYPNLYSLSISPDLTYIGVGFEEDWYGIEYRAYIEDLTTGTQLDLPDLMPYAVGLSRLYSFSPQGTYFTLGTSYLTAYYAPELEQLYEAGSLIHILDPEGNILHVVGEPEGPEPLVWYLEAPTWQADEQAIVFYAYGSEHMYLMRYSLPDRQLTPLYELGEAGHEPYVYAPFVTSPGNTHIALTVSSEAYGTRKLAVLYPDGEIYRIPMTHTFGLYPVWVPPDTNE